jgi:hypothetical protein
VFKKLVGPFDIEWDTAVPGKDPVKCRFRKRAITRKGLLMGVPTTWSMLSILHLASIHIADELASSANVGRSDLLPIVVLAKELMSGNSDLTRRDVREYLQGRKRVVLPNSNKLTHAGPVSSRCSLDYTSSI